MPVLLGFFNIGPMEMVILLGIGVLLFGGRLPEVGRSLGKSLMEFKKGMQGLENEFHAATSAVTSESPAAEPVRTPYQDIDDREEATAPKFEPPAAEV